MTGLLEVQKGENLGAINYHLLDGTNVDCAGTLIEGIVPDGAVLSSRAVHTYIAQGVKFSDRAPRDELIVGVERTGLHKATIGINALAIDPKNGERVTKHEIGVDPKLLEGALKMVMKETDVRVGIIDTGSSVIKPELAERLGLEQRQESGAYVFRPRFAKIGVGQVGWWRQVIEQPAW